MIWRPFKSAGLRLVVLLLVLVSPVSADNVSTPLGGVSNPNSNISDPDGGVSNPAGGGVNITATFFVAAAGSDANAGTQNHPWQTVAKVNSSATAGAIVKFNGGDSFATTTGILAPVNVTSYGTGQATITSGNSAPCISQTNPPISVTISNIVCTGGGNTTNTTSGISFVNSQSGNTKLPGPTISGVTVSGYGYIGINIQGTSGSSGFSGFNISGNTITNVTGNSTNSSGSACIMVFSLTNYGSGATTPAHINGVIKNNTVSNCTGTNGGGMTNWSGSGIFVSEARSVTIGGCATCGNIVHDFGSLNNGAAEPAGAWSADADQITISYNEVYNGTVGPSGKDPDCGGFDGGQTNSVFAYNKCHDNAGIGMTAENYFDGTCCALWGNNTYAFNLLQNNLKNQTTVSEIFFLFSQAGTGPAYVYNNTVVQEYGGSAIGDVSSSNQAYTINVANNIFAVNNGGKFTNFTHPPTATFIGNDYYTYGTTATWAWNGSTYTNATLATAFSAWQTATGQEKISGSNVGLTSNPSLYAPGGLFTTGGYTPLKDMADNLQVGSPMIATGQNVTTQFAITPLAIDYYGVAVTASTLPVGAAAGDFVTFASSCTLATNFLARVSSFTKQDNVNYNSLLCSGYFANFDLLYVPAAPNAAAALLNLMSATFPLTVNGSCTFTARTGYAGNATNCDLATGWTPSTNAVNYTLSSVTHFGYMLTNGLADSQAIYGVANTTNTSEASNFPGTGGWYADANDVTGATSAGTTVSKGMFLLDRNSSNVLTEYFNGTNVHNVTVAPVSLPNQAFVLLGFTGSTGTVGSFSGNTIAAAGFGAGSQNDPAISQQINSFMMAYGINTY